MKQRHFKDGHLNAYTLDQDSYITGKGKHYRVVAFIPDRRDGLYCRIDHKHGDRMPTDREVLDVAERANDAKYGRLKCYKRETINTSTDMYFR